MGWVLIWIGRLALAGIRLMGWCSIGLVVLLFTEGERIEEKWAGSLACLGLMLKWCQIGF